MRKLYAMLGLTICMGTASLAVMAKEPVAVPISQVAQEENLVSIHQINMNVPITSAEFIIAILETTGVDLPMVMDTHYGLPAMQRAAELGLIDLDKYPMETWSQIMSNEEKTEVLSKAMKNNAIDMEKVYTALSQILVEYIEIDGQPVDLEGLSVSHSQGKLMLPLRPIAEAMGFKVTWDKETYSATINNGQVQSTIQVGFDSYAYTSVQAIGMSAPFSEGAAPRLIEGTVYVPVGCFSMFSEREIVNNTVRFKMK